MDAAALPCARCGYDLRAQPADGVCPECGETVAEARRLSAVPIRPAWADSDPRWRRRMVAGAWVLVFVPLVEVLQMLGWSYRPFAPVFWEPQFTFVSLYDTFFTIVYAYACVGIGIVLFFVKERGRRRNRLDWTRRWGIALSYVMPLLIVAGLARIVCMVAVGIAAMFQSLPPANQPPVTVFLAEFGSTYVKYGPQLSDRGYFVAAAISSCLVLLACVPLYNALRSSGPRWTTTVLLAPLVVAAVCHIALVIIFFINPPAIVDVEPALFFFEPYRMSKDFLDGWYVHGYRSGFVTVWNFGEELAKWLSCVGIALWLSVAQLRAWRRGRSAPPAASAAV